MAACTTMGFQAVDPTNPKDLGDAAERFFDGGADFSSNGEYTPRCCPLFTVNNQIIEWLLKDERAR